MERFQGGLVFFVSLNSRLESNKEEEKGKWFGGGGGTLDPQHLRVLMSVMAHVWKYPADTAFAVLLLDLGLRVMGSNFGGLGDRIQGIHHLKINYCTKIQIMGSISGGLEDRG